MCINNSAYFSKEKVKGRSEEIETYKISEGSLIKVGFKI